MQIGAIIPVKIISKSKARLRKAHSGLKFNKLINKLSEQLFYIVLSAVFFSKKVSDLLIATSDPKIIEVLSHLGINSYMDRWADLNLIVKDGISILRNSGCEMGLILMADLPCITERSIDSLFDLHILTKSIDCFVVLRSSDHGTTGIVQKPLGITPSFLNYANSAEKHLEYAVTHRIPQTVVDTEEFCFDIDTVNDLSGNMARTEDDELTNLVYQIRNLLNSK